jgi:membrane protease YdiL (CAAX protease family)
VLKLALLFEIPLTCPYLISAYYNNSWSALDLPSFKGLFIAIVASLLLFLLNLLFYAVTYKFKLANMISFIEGVVEPLAASLTLRSALLVSIAAGVGEEFFFRGFLLPLIGLLGSSLAFSLTHFFFEIRKYLALCIIYTIIGMIFGFLYRYSSSLWVVVIFHSLYDFMALLFFKSKFRFKLKSIC